MKKNSDISGRSSLLKKNSTNEIIADSTTLLRNAGFAESYIEQFTECVIAVQDDYAELLGEGTAIEYTLKKKLSKVKLRMQIPGAAYDIVTIGSEARKRQYPEKWKQASPVFYSPAI